MRRSAASMSARVALITDSSACLPAGLVRRYRIVVVRHTFVFDGQTYQDGTLSSRKFYGLLRSSRRLPTTSSPPPGEFLEAFRRAREAGAEAVLCLTFSGRYSATYNSASAARDMVSEETPAFPVLVVDTHGLAMSHGFAVLTAARALQEGASVEQAAARAAEVGSRAYLIGMLDTLRYLAMGGRVPRIVHWATAALQIKPIFAAEGEEVRPIERARTRQRALSRLLRHLEQRTEAGQPLHVAVMHADAPEVAQTLADEIRRRFQPAELLVTEFSNVMGVHVGPGFVGIAFYSEVDSACRSRRVNSTAERLSKV